MSPLKVAVLEDNKTFLKELVDNLKRTELVQVIIYEDQSESFITKVRESPPEALLLDIHLKDENTNGVLIAGLLKLPVLFLSAEQKEFLPQIDELKLCGDFPVEHIGKTPDEEKLRKILRSFVPRVREYQKSRKVKIKPIGQEEMFINPSEVCFILSSGGNQTIYFSDRKPITVADKSFDHFRQNGFPEERFALFGRSYLLNIALTTYDDGHLMVQYMSDTYKKEEKIKVPADKRKEARQKFSK